MLECLHHKTWGGKWFSFLCCHTWSKVRDIKSFPLIIEKNRCIDCGKTEILILIDW